MKFSPKLPKQTWKEKFEGDEIVLANVARVLIDSGYYHRGISDGVQEIANDLRKAKKFIKRLKGDKR